MQPEGITFVHEPAIAFNFLRLGGGGGGDWAIFLRKIYFSHPQVVQARLF